MNFLVDNKKALFNYDLVLRLEAGIVLQGWEVKSIKDKRASLKESYVIIRNNRAYLIGAHVARWTGANINSDLEYRDRELLLNKKEVKELAMEVKIKGQTIVPLNIHLHRNIIKLEIALAKGKKMYDKRAVIKERDQKREIERDLKKMGYK
jgi:SsrA-binding protein